VGTFIDRTVPARNGVDDVGFMSSFFSHVECTPSRWVNLIEGRSVPLAGTSDAQQLESPREATPQTRRWEANGDGGAALVRAHDVVVAVLPATRSSGANGRTMNAIVPYLDHQGVPLGDPTECGAESARVLKRLPPRVLKRLPPRP
jgi:hypothetical protein